MSCDIANGRAEVCKDTVGGIDTVYFVNFGDFNPDVDVTYDNTNTDLINSIANLTNLYKFTLKGANSYTETITTDRNNGTTFFSQELVINLKKQDAATQKLVKLLAYGRPQIIIRGRDNTFRIAGLHRGMDLTAGSIAMGAEMSDMNGYTLTFTGTEALPASFINCTTEAGLITDLANPNVITS